MSYHPYLAATAAIVLIGTVLTAPSAFAATNSDAPAAPTATDPDGAGEPGQVAHHRFESPSQWREGESDGIWTFPVSRGGILMGWPAGTHEYTDPHTEVTRTYEYSTWTSPMIDVDFDATELVASWNASTPEGSWIEIELQATYTNGETSPWAVMGRWSSDDEQDDIRRTTVNGQGDAYSSVWTDTFAIDDASAGVLIDGYQLRLTLNRPEDSNRSPRVWMVGAMASAIPDRFEAPPAEGGIAWGTELAVPRRSQNIHEGNYPEYGGGGQVWCSPTSTTMVMEYFGFRPSRKDMSWIEPGYTDPQVAHAARMTWDYAYSGAGNWTFNTAYAASSSIMLDAFVTRLRSMDDLERFIAAGIPVVTSQSFLESELDGAGYGTAGHLFVVVGFTDDGDVIVNDPASPSNQAVRHVYDREQFERIWLRTQRFNASGDVVGGSGGISYIIKPAWKDLPDGGDGAW